MTRTDGYYAVTTRHGTSTFGNKQKGAAPKGQRQDVCNEKFPQQLPTVTVELTLAMSGVNLIAGVTGRGSCSSTDAQLYKPRRVGIYGIADGSNVYINDFHVRPNFPSGVLQ